MARESLRVARMPEGALIHGAMGGWDEYRDGNSGVLRQQWPKLHQYGAQATTAKVAVAGGTFAL